MIMWVGVTCKKIKSSTEKTIVVRFATTNRVRQRKRNRQREEIENKRKSRTKEKAGEQITRHSRTYKYSRAIQNQLVANEMLKRAKDRNSYRAY